MVVPVADELRKAILDSIRKATGGNWKILVLDEATKKVVDNVVETGDILKANILSIEVIEKVRERSPDTDAIYLLSPEPNIAEFLIDDLNFEWYHSASLIWTAPPSSALHKRLGSSWAYKRKVGPAEIVFASFFPREAQLVTFRDPWSFTVLYHPQCNKLLDRHLAILAHKIVAVCVTLGEYPYVRYYNPRYPDSAASTICHSLAKKVQFELDQYSKHTGFGDQTAGGEVRPQGSLIITDRSTDLVAPLLHEFTYQAMAHDVLGLKEKDKVTFTLPAGKNGLAADKEMEIQENDEIWVSNRHRHMAEAIPTLNDNFDKFLDKNAKYSDTNTSTNINVIKDMMAGLKQFQAMKAAYSLHLHMAEECMSHYKKEKLDDVAMIEQTLATGLDEDNRRPKNALEVVVQLLADGQVTKLDRRRLIMLWIMYRDGVIEEDIRRLFLHSNLPLDESRTILNLKYLGGRPTRKLKEDRTPPEPLFTRSVKAVPAADVEDLAVLPRYETMLGLMLEEAARGTLDKTLFPYVYPPPDSGEDRPVPQSGSLRTGRRNWAAQGRRPTENRERILVFMAGGATYSESRVCYEKTNSLMRDIYLISSHMLTPKFYCRLLEDLSTDKNAIDLPMERSKPLPKPKPPVTRTVGPAGAGIPGGPRTAANIRAEPGPTLIPGGGLPPQPTTTRPQAMPSPAMASPQMDVPPTSSGPGEPASSTGGDGKKRRNFFRGLKK